MKREELARLKSWFADYCKTFYSENLEEQQNITLKEIHTSRVCANMARLAESLELDENDKTIAETIALFHDVGRFPQYRRYRTFRDSDSVNHAALGVETLRNEGVLDGVPAAERDVIIRAIALHNAFQVPTGLDSRSSLFARMVRDADKLDIWRIFTEYYALPENERASAVGLGFPDAPLCSAEVLQALLSGEMVRLSTLKTLSDFKLLQISWLYDLNFPGSFRMAEKDGHLRAIAATIPADEETARAVAYAMKLLDRSAK